MTKRKTLMCRGLAVLGGLLVVGCAKPAMDMTSMKPPERAKELDLLEPWVGQWTSTGECKMPDGKTMKGTGTQTMAWEADRRVMTERMEWDMGEMDKMHGFSVYAYDPKEKEFRTFWFNNFGEISQGEMSYDEVNKTWHMEGKSKNPVTGETSVGKGTMTMPDNSTINWTWTEWDSWKMNKKMEMTGTTKRK